MRKSRNEMRSHRKSREAAERFSERRRREEEAPRLASEIPDLESLALQIRDRAGSGPAPEPSYTRRVVVESAPALFVIPCGDRRCEDGGHDVTPMVMRALRARLPEFSGEDACGGSLGAHGQCARVLHFTGKATYGPKAS